MIGNTLCIDKECLENARKQFCLDMGLPWEEYVTNKQKKVFIQKSKYKQEAGTIVTEGARSYAERNAFFWAIICLGQLFITCDECIYDWIVQQYAECSPEWFCNYENLRKLDEKLAEYGYGIYDTHVYFLPEEKITDNSKKYQGKWNNEVQVNKETESKKQDLVWFSQEEILRFKDNNRFTSAICFWEGQPDVLAAVYMREMCSNEDRQVKEGKRDICQSGEKDFDQSHMAAMVGASADGEYLWQIGINVDEEYAGRGLGHRLVRAMKEEIRKIGKVPFYGTSESHTVSQTVGLKAGFVPAWTEVSACIRK